MNYYKGLALFAGGVLFGSAGIKLLSSKDAKKVYIHATAAGLRDERLRHGNSNPCPGKCR